MMRLVRAFGLTFAVGLVACGSIAKGESLMFDIGQSSPLCIGRLVVDLPGGTRPTLSATFQFMEAKQPESAASFDTIKEKVEKKIEVLANIKTERSESSDRLARRAGFDPDKVFSESQLVGSQVDDSERQAAIGYLEKPNLPRVISELHKFYNGYEYVFRSEGGGAETYKVTGSRMWNAALNFHPLAHGEVPTAPGFCVAGGMFADGGKPPLREDFTLVASFDNHPDARFVIDGFAIDEIDKSEPSLRSRANSELRILQANVDGHVSVLVRGEREVAGQPGYQIGLSVPNDTVSGTTAYKFFWSAEGVPNDASRPFMEVSLTIQPEDDKPASFADAKQAQAFWDHLLQGLRIRLGAVGR